MLLFLSLQHGKVEIDEFQVACWCSIVTSTKFSIEDFRHRTDTGVNFHTHFCYRFLQVYHVQHNQSVYLTFIIVLCLIISLHVQYFKITVSLRTCRVHATIYGSGHQIIQLFEM